MADTEPDIYYIDEAQAKVLQQQTLDSVGRTAGELRAMDRAGDWEREADKHAWFEYRGVGGE